MTVQEVEARGGALHREHAGLFEHLLQLLLRQTVCACTACVCTRAAVAAGSALCGGLLHALQGLKLLHDSLWRLVILDVAHVVRRANTWPPQPRVAAAAPAAPRTHLGCLARAVHARFARPSDMLLAKTTKTGRSRATRHARPRRPRTGAEADAVAGLYRQAAWSCAQVEAC